MNFQRGLVRHGYMESNDYILTSTFFLATALVVLSFIPWRDLFSKYSIFFGFSFFLILILKNFAIDKGPAPLENFLKTANIASLDEECKNGTLVGRVIANHDFASKNYTELKQFLDEYLTDEQTFLNFSSTPMLYYYCQRRVPAYFCQNHQNTVDDFLQLDHLNRINPEDVPIVFTDGPIVWQFAHPRNSSDGVLHSMRQYLISEYIYKNYQPIGSINKQTVWASKFIDIPEEIIDVNLSIDNSYLAIFGNFAAAIDNHFFRDGSVKLKRIKTSVATNEDEELDIFSIDDSVRDSSIFIRLHIQNPMDDREITVTTVDVDGKPLGNMTFNCIEGQKTYTLFLSNYYLWYHRTPKFLKIPKWSGMIINKVEFYKDERTEPTHN